MNRIHSPQTRDLRHAALTLGACAFLLYWLVRAATGAVGGPVPALAVGALLLAVAAFGMQLPGYAALLVGTFLTPMYSLEPGDSGTSLVTFGDVFLVVGFILLLPRVVRGRLAAPPMHVVGAALFIPAGILASTFASEPSKSFGEFARIVSTAVLLPVVLQLWGPTKKHIIGLAGAYCLGSAYSVLYGLVTNETSAEGRYIGLAGHPNGLGLTCLFGLALTPFLLKAVQRHHQWVWLTAAAVNVVGIWVSGSRAALLVTLILILIVPLLSRSGLAAGGLLLAGGLVLLSANRLLATTGGNALGRLLGFGSASASDEDRSARIETIIGVIKDHPFLGSGFIDTSYAHVVYLQIWACGGFFALLGFGAILLAADRQVFAAPQPYNELAYPAISYTLVALLTNLVWDRFIWIPISLGLIAGSMVRARADGTIDDGVDSKDRVFANQGAGELPAGQRRG